MQFNCVEENITIGAGQTRIAINGKVISPGPNKEIKKEKKPKMNLDEYFKKQKEEMDKHFKKQREEMEKSFNYENFGKKFECNAEEIPENDNVDDGKLWTKNIRKFGNWTFRLVNVGDEKKVSIEGPGCSQVYIALDATHISGAMIFTKDKISIDGIIYVENGIVLKEPKKSNMDHMSAALSAWFN